ncbi:MAG: class II fructose-bisphosphate aldolase [Patescibacteria group bacterium]
MLVKPHQLFDRARRGGFALGAFTGVSSEIMQAILKAADEERSPVIIRTPEQMVRRVGPKILVGMVRLLTDDAECACVLHLDQGTDFSFIQACIEAGYTSVMVEAGAGLLPRNIQKCREVAEYGRGRGVWVEAGMGGDTSRVIPEEAKELAEATGVDAISFACGTVYGAFTGQEYIQFELIDAIQKLLPGLPLVLQGASGLADRHITEVAQGNVCQVNFETEVHAAYIGAFKGSLGDTGVTTPLPQLLDNAQAAVQRVVARKLRTLGSSGQTEYLGYN